MDMINHHPLVLQLHSIVLPDPVHSLQIHYHIPIEILTRLPHYPIHLICRYPQVAYQHLHLVYQHLHPAFLCHLLIMKQRKLKGKNCYGGLCVPSWSGDKQHQILLKFKGTAVPMTL